MAWLYGTTSLFLFGHLRPVCPGVRRNVWFLPWYMKVLTAWNFCPPQTDFLVLLGVGAQFPSLIRVLAFSKRINVIMSLSCLKVYICFIAVGIRSHILNVKDEAPSSPPAISFRDIHPFSLTLIGLSSILERMCCLLGLGLFMCSSLPGMLFWLLFPWLIHPHLPCPILKMH